LIKTAACDSTVYHFQYFQFNPKDFLKVVMIKKLVNTDIKNHPVILNNGDNNESCCSAFWVPPIKTRFIHWIL